MNRPIVNRPHRWKIRLMAALLSLLAVTVSSAVETNVVSWPPPPAEPYVVYLRDISSPRDIGVRPSFFSRVADTLTGSKSSAQRLVKPFGLSLDETGNLVIADTGANAVCYLDLARKKWSSWSAVGGHPFSSPVAAVHHGDIFYVADSTQGKVIAFDEKGKARFEITNRLERPTGLAVAGEHLLVVDSQLHQVFIYDLQGDFISAFGKRGAGAGEFNFPTHINVDGAGRIYVTDSLNHRIQIFDAAGNFLREFGKAGDGPGRFSRPKGVAVDTAGHVYVVDADFSNVQIFNESGRLLLDVGEPGQGAGKFWLPNAIAINSQNEIFIADAYNQRVQVLRYTGKE